MKVVSVPAPLGYVVIKNLEMCEALRAAYEKHGNGVYLVHATKSDALTESAALYDWTLMKRPIGRMFSEPQIGDFQVGIIGAVAIHENMAIVSTFFDKSVEVRGRRGVWSLPEDLQESIPDVTKIQNAYENLTSERPQSSTGDETGASSAQDLKETVSPDDESSDEEDD